MPPDQMAMIAVIDPDQAAQPLTGIVVRDREPRHDLDLKLSAGARFVARLIDLAGKPIAGGQLTMNIRGAELPEEFRGGNTYGDRQEIVTWSKADADGLVKLRLAPGDYTILGHENLHVDGPGEIVREYRQERREFETKPILLSGQILDAIGALGRPVAGAIVRFIPSTRNGGANIKGVTDSDGRFQLEPYRPVDGGFLIAHNPAGTRAGLRWVDQAGEQAKVTLGPASVGSGRVIDAEGRAVAGHPVQLTMSIAVDPSRSIQTYENTRTDDDGRYRFVGLIPGTKAEVIVHDRNDSELQSPIHLERFDVNGPDPITIADLKLDGEPKPTPPGRFGPKFTASEVVGANPMPYAISRRDVEDLVRAIGREPATPAVIDRVGWIVRPQQSWITDLAPIRRFATDPQFVALADRATTAVLGKPADTATLVYLAHYHRAGGDEAPLKELLATFPGSRPTKPVHGVVEDHATGRAIAGATVFTDNGFTRTNDLGAFTVAAAKRRNLWVEADGYALTEVIPSTDPDHPSKIGLVREQPIVGVVVDRGFQPVAGAIVWAMVNHSVFRPGTSGKSDHYGFPLTARTDAQGRFAFRGMPPGASLGWFEVQHPTLRLPWGKRGTLTAETLAGLIVEPGAVVSGEVVDENGRGVADAAVALRPNGENLDRYQATTDADGRYRFANVAAGRLDLTVEPQRQAFKRIPIFAEVDRPAINQVVVEAGWTIGGQVVDEAGRPIAGADVSFPTLLDDSGHPDSAFTLNRSVVTDAEGSFQLHGLAFGKYRLTVSTRTPQRQVKVEAQVNRPDIVIRLPDEGK